MHPYLLSLDQSLPMARKVADDGVRADEDERAAVLQCDEDDDGLVARLRLLSRTLRKEA